MNPSSPSVDGVTPPETPDAASSGKSKRVRFYVVVGGAYVLYVSWSVILMALLPSTDGSMNFLIAPGVMVAIAVALFSVGFFTLGFLRIRSSVGYSQQTKVLSIVRIAAMTVPGFLISVIVPFVIIREPPVGIEIIEPTSREDLVAPLAVTFGLDRAVQTLTARDLTPTGYSWDFNGDGQKDEDTVEPRATGVYDRQGAYTVVARIELSDGSYRRMTRQLAIPRAVFSTAPIQPIVDEPTVFSVAHLIEDPKLVRSVEWDFDNDGTPDVTGPDVQTAHTFVQIGDVTVSVVVLLENQTQTTYERTLTVRDPPPLPFPITLMVEPRHLISPPPFGTIFRIETEEPLREIAWDFGDGDTAKGERVGHTFTKKGVYTVRMAARSESGETARLSKVVQIVNQLRLSDLKFDGSVEVDGNTIEAEVPVTVELTPRTGVPLVSFDWEAPDATVLGSTETTLNAIYREVGTYIITLVARDPDGKAMRMPITLEVKPRSSFMAINMLPEGGTAPLTVEFDASESVIPGKEISGFEWTFTGEDLETAPQQRGAQVEYVFDDPGTYEILLKAYTTDGNSYEETRTIVVRRPILSACFVPSRTQGIAPLGVQFDLSCTTGSLQEVLWDFGDASQSDRRNPIHVFEQPGTFVVELTVKDAAGSVSTESVTITVIEDQ